MSATCAPSGRACAPVYGAVQMPHVDAPLGAPGDDPFVAPADDRGYRAGIRMGDRGARRPRRVAAIVATLVLTGAVSASLDPSTFTGGDPGDGADAGRVAATPGLPTPLPLVARADGAPVIAPLPVVAGSLRWVEPATGLLEGDAFETDRGAILVRSDGTVVCVCRDSPWSTGGVVDRVTLVRYDATGRVVGQGVALELASPLDARPRDPILRDVAVSPDGRYLQLARAVADETNWTLGLDTIQLDDLAITARLELGTLPRLDRMRLQVPVVRVTPDGRHVRVAVRWWAEEGTDGTLGSGGWSERTWLLAADDAGGLVTVRATEPAPTDVPDRCDGEDWATPDRYVLVCRRVATDTIVPFVRLETLEGGVSEIPMGEPVGRDRVDWLLDRRSGALYRWSPWTHALVRLDIAASTVGAARTAVVDPSRVDTPGGRDDAPDLAPGLPPITAPATGDRRWSTLISLAEHPDVSRIAGSTDGTRIFVLGVRAAGPGNPGGRDGTASTGIWVFDSATLALVDRWSPNALYDSIAVTPDGTHVVAAGVPGRTADGRTAAWSSSLTFHDAATGRVDIVLGDVLDVSGFRPILLAVNAR